MGLAHSEQVAIIDDDTSLCRSLSRLLRLAGYQPSTFGSAEEFISASSAAPFACALVDVQLPGMSGLEMQRALVALGRCTPLIFVTAHEEPAVRADAMKGGCAGFFGKTEDGARILAAVRAVTQPS